MRVCVVRDARGLGGCTQRAWRGVILVAQVTGGRRVRGRAGKSVDEMKETQCGRRPHPSMQ